MSIPLVVLAAGLSTRYGRLKQLDPLGPNGGTIVDYNVYDALRAGFDRLILITRPEIEDQLREHTRKTYGDGVDVTFVRQLTDDLPEGFRAPPDRVRPWGTGHAVLSLHDAVDGPFAVCNADDHYGARAFADLHRHLSEDPPLTDGALVGYTLSDTLSGHGGVARAVCVLGKEGLLSQISEVRNILRRDGWITGRTLSDQNLELTGSEIVSMNLWGLSPGVLRRMERQFERFLGTWGADTMQEFYLSVALNDQIRVGATSIAVLQTDDDWFGVTHADDREAACTKLANLVRDGEYPENLSEAFKHGVGPTT